MLSLMRDLANKQEDEDVRKSPFVFLMNRAKLEAMQSKEPEGISFVKSPCSFSMFNRQTEYPFDPVPNAFKINPAGEMGGDADQA